MGGVWDPDRGQLAGAQKPGQADRVAPVGLDPVARLPRDQRRRDHDAGVPEPGEQSVEPVPGRPGFVAKVQALVLAGQLRCQAAHAVRRRVHLAVEPHLTIAPGVSDRHRIAQLCHVDPDECFLVLGHRLSSSDEKQLVAGPPLVCRVGGANRRLRRRTYGLTHVQTPCRSASVLGTR